MGIVCDFARHHILCGDSFGQEPPANMIAAVEWWTHHHTRTTFANGHLDITKQKDTFSCGMYSHNGLAHFVNPG